MKIEKLNENQIRCIVEKTDLEQRQLKLSELAYGSSKAKALVRDMMEKAAAECGFEADNIPLMIEAIPISFDCLILVVTKVEDPEVLDTRFSRFSSLAGSEEEEEDMEDEEFFEGSEDDDEEPLSFNPSEDDGNDGESSSGEQSLGILDSFTKALSSAKEEYLKKKSEERPAKPASEQIYAFDSLDEVLRLCGHLTPFYSGDSALYKDQAQGAYYLVLVKKDMDQALYDRACTICSDYGESIRTSYASLSYFREHFRLICRENALETLAHLNG